VPAFEWIETVERIRSSAQATQTVSSAADSRPTDGADSPRAAVASVLRQGMHDIEVLFIKRAERQGDPWSGHVAFPGGKREAEDPSLLATAVRETQEEVGLLLQPESFVARLFDVRARLNGYRVAHFVFQLDDRSAPLAMSPEVAAALWVPLASLAEVERASSTVSPSGFPSVKLGDYVLWGMTYRMVGHLLDAAEGGAKR
jgi:8-oxo-dGTP pyrophosphatase MutT (NUDIX family)